MRTLLAFGLIVLCAPTAFAQNWGEIEGRITQRGGAALPGANVVVTGTSFGTATEDDGSFTIRIPIGQYALTVSAVGFQAVTDSVLVRKNQTTRFDVTLDETDIELGGVEVEAEGGYNEAGVSELSGRQAQDIPSTLSDTDGLRAVKTLVGVTSNNETSYQYSVRGGGYNENLYFIDGFEVYTPFRTKQGEQEGLGIVNLDMTDRLTLYAGGFPARYGGKLASALDVAYIRPAQGDGFSGTAYGSTLDAGGSLKGAVMGGKLGIALAGRNAQARSFFATQELKGEYDPQFSDVQGTLTYRIADGHEVHGLGLYLDHSFRLDPTRRRTYFGTFQDLRSVSFGFDGFEEDGYALGFGGVRVLNKITNALRIEHEASYFDVEETEELDIRGSVSLFRLGNPFEDPDAPENQIQTGAATQQDTANNVVRVTTLTGGGRYRLALGRHATEAGWTARRFEFDDRLFEVSYTRGKGIDGNPVRVALDSLNDRSSFSEVQGGFYIQDAFDVLPASGILVVTGGVRADYFSFNEEWTFSPRLSARYVWDERTTLTAAAGVYHQAPTYRELRGEPIYDTTAAQGNAEIILGALNRDIKSQRSLQFIVGAERFFPSVRFYGRAEAYYKKLDNLITYNQDNVRTIYSGDNDAKGYAYGLDLQLRGEFVPGLESWLNYGFLVAREEVLPEFETPNNAGLRPRPTDRRHNVALFVQDYVPNSDSWKLHLRGLFGSGTPYTAPAPGEEVAGIQLRVPGDRNASRYPEYRRVDMGVTKEAVLAPRSPTGNAVRLELTGEVLNVFDMTNTISYSYVAGADGVWQRIPTRLTPRTVNVRMRLSF